MLNNRIGSRKIEERLGRSGLRSDDLDHPRTVEAASNGNMIFACLVVGLFITGAGIGLAASKRSSDLRQAILEGIFGPPAPPPYRSRVADTCDKGWKDDRYNRDQIHCYMTQEVARLCDPRERRALVDKLLAYQTAMNRSDGRFNLAALQSIPNPAAALALEISDAKSRDPNLSEKEREEQVAKTWEISRRILSPVQQIEQENINTATKKDLVADVKSLTEQGYLAAADFASESQPKIVKEGLAAAGAAGHPYCP